VIYSASELAAAGFSSGSIINRLSLNVTTVGNTRTGFTIGYKFQSASVFPNSTMLTGFTTVFTLATLSPTVGINTYTFNTPTLAWNGTDNVVFDFCYSNNASGSANNVISAVAATTGITVLQATADNTTTLCSTTLGTTGNTRPYIILGGEKVTTSSITWAPTTALYTNVAATTSYSGNASATVYAKPTETITYTATATSADGCSSSNEINIAVNALPSALVLTGSTVCSGSTTTITSTTSQSGVNYQLFNSSNTAVGSPIAGTGSGLTWSGVSAGTGYYVRGTNASTACVSANSNAVNVTVNALPTALVLAGSAVCSGSTTTITSTTSQSGVNYQLFNSSNSAVGSPIAGTGSGLTWSSIAAGTGYYVKGTNSLTSCVSANSNAVTVTVSTNSVGGTLNGSATVCSGTNLTTLTLEGYTGTITKWQWSTLSDFSNVTDIVYTQQQLPVQNLGQTTYYRVVVTNGACSSTNSTSAIITVNTTPAVTATTPGSGCPNGTVTLSATGTIGSTFKWYSGSIGGNPLGTSATFTTPVLSATTNYYAEATLGSCVSPRVSAVATINPTGTWIGSSSGDWNDNGNWCGGVPSSSAVITSNSQVTLSGTSVVTVTNLTLNSGSILIIPNGSKLTISGALVNNGGTLKIESGGSLVQEGSTANSGTGTYIAQRTLTGSTGSNGQPNDRQWYIGVPMSGATSTSLAAGGINRLWSYNEQNGLWGEILADGVPMSQGYGYVFLGGSAATHSFSSNNIGNGSVSFDLTRSANSPKPGFNLISNPYPSHVSWDALYNSTVSYATVPTGSSPLLPTIWYRTTATNSTTMLFDTYNATIGAGTNNGATGTSYNGTPVTGTIAPFQSFWVRLNTGTPTYTMYANNTMRSHGTQNLLTLTPATVRLNISNGVYHDETIVVLKEDLSNDYDYRDSGKEIPSTTVHQLYSLEGSTRVAINGIADALAKDSLKLGVQIPTAGTYSINCTELTFSDMVFLEDKLTGSYLELNSTTNYSFTSTQGTFNNRFVLHFAPNVPALPGQTAATAIAMPTSNWPQCNNVTSEDQWHAFTATSEGISIAVSTATTDIVIELQDGTGNVVAQENAVNGIGNETLNFFGLTAGQIYKVGVRNNISSQPTGSYGICVKSLKRGGCDYGAGPYSLCQYYKATWAGSTGVSYTFTFTGTSGPAAGQTFTRTQNSDICVLSTVTPLLPYGSTYDVVISNTYTLTDGAGNTEQITVPSNNGCQVITIAEPQTALSNSNSCNNGARFRGAVVSSMPWVCGTNNWRWRFTEVNPLTMQEVGLPIELNRGSASNYLNLGTVAQLQNGKTYAVQTAPMFSYTGTNYNWGPVQYMCIVGNTAMSLDGTSEAGASEENNNKNLVEDKTNTVVYVTEGNHVNIQLTNTATNTAKRADIYDVTGKLVKSVRLVEGMNEVTLTETAGIYMVRTVVGNQSETTRVFLNN